MSATICPQCPQCSDSPLSITASITGILTFALAVLATIRLYVTSYRESPKEIEKLHRAVAHAERDYTFQSYKIGSYRELRNDNHAHDLLRESLLTTKLRNCYRTVITLRRGSLYHNKRVSWGFRARGRFLALRSDLLKLLEEGNAALDKVRVALDRCVRLELDQGHS